MYGEGFKVHFIGFSWCDVNFISYLHSFPVLPTADFMLTFPASTFCFSFIVLDAKPRALPQANWVLYSRALSPTCLVFNS